MKRILLTVILSLLCTGCINITNSSKEEIIEATLNSKYQITNCINAGYKYYLPNNMQRTIKNGNNELLKDKHYEYYFYVDLVSYYNKIINIYNKDEKAYFSITLDYNNHFGYLNIYEEEDNKYLIEAVYNYGKIETKVLKKDINTSISQILTVLSSIEYNDNTIKKMMENNTISSKDEIVNIFDKKENQNHDYLEEDDDVYTEEEVDPDVIN